jgi:hypothetical protein
MKRIDNISSYLPIPGVVFFLMLYFDISMGEVSDSTSTALERPFLELRMEVIGV